MKSVTHGKVRVWIEGQAGPVIGTYPLTEEAIQPCPSPDFVKVRNIRGGDWILPKARILKVHLGELPQEELDLAMETVVINHHSVERLSL